MSLIDFIQGALMVGVGMVISYIIAMVFVVIAIKAELMTKFSMWYLNTITKQYTEETNKEDEA